LCLSSRGSARGARIALGTLALLADTLAFLTGAGIAARGSTRIGGARRILTAGSRFVRLRGLLLRRLRAALAAALRAEAGAGSAAAGIALRGAARCVTGAAGRLARGGRLTAGAGLLGLRSSFLRLTLLSLAFLCRRALGLSRLLVAGSTFRRRTFRGSRARVRQGGRVVMHRADVGDQVRALLRPRDTRKAHLRAGREL